MWRLIDTLPRQRRRTPLLVLTVVALATAALSRPAPTQGASLTRATEYLRQNAVGLGLQPGLVDLRLAGHKQSLTADHYRYQQTIGGVPVLGATVVVSVPKNSSKQPRVVNHYAAAARAVIGQPAAALVSPGRALAQAASALGSDVREMAFPELVYVAGDDKRFALAWKLTLETEDPFGHWMVLVDGAGRPLQRVSLLQYDSGQVFAPNPGQTNGGPPPAPDCDSPAAEALLAGHYRWETLQGITPGQGKLKGEFVDLTAPGISGGYKPAGLADEPSHQYVYGCDDDRFEEVMVYAYVDRTQRKVQSLGFTGERAIVDRPIPAHAHFYEDCNAFFSRADHGLHFGDGENGATCSILPIPGLAPDAGEDGDIVVHEYGHALQEEQLPGFGAVPPPFLEQPGAIAEGFGDFLAAVLNDDPCVGEYSRESIPLCNGSPGGGLDNTMTYPSGYEACPDWDYDGDGFPESEEVHCGGLLWGGALWDLVKAIGEGEATQEARDTALRLVLESQFYMDQASGFDEAAAAICYADGLLYGGVHQGLIALVFAARGISPGDCVPDDFGSIYFQIRHPSRGDLDVRLIVGPDKENPLCEVGLHDPNIFEFVPNLEVMLPLDSPNLCEGYLPPTTDQPFWLQVRDAFQRDVGSIDSFLVLLEGGVRCIATDTPVAIPDNGPPVYSKVDCTTKMGPGAGVPSPTDEATPTPPAGGGVKGDMDCNGAVDSVDGLRILRYAAGLNPNVPGACPGPGSLAGAGPKGDMDCNTTVDSVDALRILRYAAGLSPGLPGGCPAIGAPIGSSTPSPSPTPTPTPTSLPTATATPTPSPAPTATPAGQVFPRNSTWHYTVGGSIRVAGEVYNGLGYPIEGVTVLARYYSGSNDLLATETGFTCLAALPAGGDSPYSVLLADPPAGVHHVTVEVLDYSGPPLLFPPPVGLNVSVTDTYTDFLGDFHVLGDVENTSLQTYTFVKVCSAFYDAAGHVVDTDFDYADPSTIGPGESGAFDTWADAALGIEGYRAWADGSW